MRLLGFVSYSTQKKTRLRATSLKCSLTFVEVYAAEHYPIDPPSPSAAIEYHMDQTGKAPTDLAPLIEKRDKVS